MVELSRYIMAIHENRIGQDKIHDAWYMRAGSHATQDRQNGRLGGKRARALDTSSRRRGGAAGRPPYSLALLSLAHCSYHTLPNSLRSASRRWSSSKRFSSAASPAPLISATSTLYISALMVP